MKLLPKALLRLIPVLALSAAPPCWAAEEPAATEPPPVTIVKGGGVAEVYRSEGEDFAAYGPDGKQPAAPSEPDEQRALNAIGKATDIELVALKPEPGVPANNSCGSICVGGYPVAARVPVKGVHQLDFVRETVADWLVERAPANAACEPVFDHAVKFASDSYRYEILLAYNCARYRVLRGGLPIAEGTAANPPGREGLEALIKAG